MKNKFTFLIAFLIFGLNSCQQNDIQNDNTLIKADEKSEQLINANNDFGLDLFREVRSESDKENIMISPLSISVALAMTYNGAEGETKHEMEETLRVSGLTPEDINASYFTLIKALQLVDEDVVFEIANAIYFADFFHVKDDFLEINKTNYDAEVSALDFKSPSTVETINEWVAEKTHDKILSIIGKLSDDDRMVLLNAIYFNGIWSQEFDKNGTRLRNFKTTDGTNIEVPMMSKEDALAYTSNDLYQAIRMPYGNKQYYMVVMLPSEGKNSQDIIDDLNSENWKAMMEAFTMEDHVIFKMPRFKFSFDSELNNALKKMGMNKAFNPALSDFSGISDDSDLVISSVLHKTYVDVNETGTEAAAVTAVIITVTSAGPDDVKRIYFTVDKPFVFAITEKDTGTILFIGEVQNPVYDK